MTKRRPTKKLRYAQAESPIRDGDLLLFHALPWWLSWLSFGIRVVGISRYSHAEMAIWWNGMLCSVGMDDQDGGRAIGLRKLVGLRTIDVYRVDVSNAAAERAAHQMLELLNEDYNHRAIRRLSRLFGPISRFAAALSPRFMRRVWDDEANGGPGPKHCSESVSWAYRLGARCDMVPNKADWATLPADLGTSACCKLLFTLIP